MTSSYEVLLARADLLPLYLARQGSRGPNAMRLGVATDVLLARLDLPAEAIPSARRALIVHAIGCAAFAGGDGPVPAEMARADFTRSLRWLLDGIAAHPGESSLP
jgi:TetR/AcrR family transcriptional regulator, tetracycline repressor protein